MSSYGLLHGLLHTQCCELAGRHHFPGSFALLCFASGLVHTFEKCYKMFCFSSLFEALGHLEKAVRTAVPAFAVTASLKVICACFAVSSRWLSQNRQFCGQFCLCHQSVVHC